MSRRWGKAGVQIGPNAARGAAEARARVAKMRLEAWKAERDAEAVERRGHADWADGLLCPDRITLALDAKGLDGPEVDAQCLAEEPEVDMWEAGTLYPSWEQTKALARLCGVTPRFLMVDEIGGRRLLPHETTLRFHAELPEPAAPIERFTEDAIRDRMNPDARAEVIALSQQVLL